MVLYNEVWHVVWPHWSIVGPQLISSNCLITNVLNKQKNSLPQQWQQAFPYNFPPPLDVSKNFNFKIKIINHLHQSSVVFSCQTRRGEPTNIITNILQDVPIVKTYRLMYPPLKQILQHLKTMMYGASPPTRARKTKFSISCPKALATSLTSTPCGHPIAHSHFLIYHHC